MLFLPDFWQTVFSSAFAVHDRSDGCAGHLVGVLPGSRQTVPSLAVEGMVERAFCSEKSDVVSRWFHFGLAQLMSSATALVLCA